MKTNDELIDSYTDFVARSEPKVKLALCTSLGVEAGLEATAHALAYGWEHWSRVSSMENPAGYLWTVGWHHGVRQNRRPAVCLPDVPVGEMPWVEPRLPAALGRLSANERVAVILIHGLEWTHSEVADLLGVSKSTVQTYATRGMRKLRRRMGVKNEE